MNFANFYPGPSRIYSCVTEFIYEAYMGGIMAANHRSEQFMEMMAETKTILKEKLLIPEDYEIAFTSSATENWEIIAQSLTQKGSFHYYNGAFGEKWFEFADKIGKATASTFGLNDALKPVSLDASYDVICVTQNETSNGTHVTNETLAAIKKGNPDKILAVDVTSSLGGIGIDFKNADYWYGSVQKCLGLPAGLGIVILSPQAVEEAYRISERNHYNSLVSMIENTRKNQTQYTPNVLGIYLLNRTQNQSKGIEYKQEKIGSRLTHYHSVINAIPEVDYLIKNEAVRSKTVLALTVNDPAKLRSEAEQMGIILGAGYGQWKDTTFRIANFPAIKTKEVNKLTAFLNNKFQD